MAQQIRCHGGDHKTQCVKRCTAVSTLSNVMMTHPDIVCAEQTSIVGLYTATHLQQRIQHRISSLTPHAMINLRHLEVVTSSSKVTAIYSNIYLQHTANATITSGSKLQPPLIKTESMQYSVALHVSLFQGSAALWDSRSLLALCI